MRIQCPSCAATYEVADSLLDPPRVVRCAQCTHDWVPTPILDAVQEPAPAGDGTPALSFQEETARPYPAPAEHLPGMAVPDGQPPPSSEPSPAALSALDRLAVVPDGTGKPASPPTGNRLLTAAWAASFLLLVLLGVAAYSKRETLMREWPASKRLYAVLGLWTPDKAATQQTPAH